MIPMRAREQSLYSPLKRRSQKMVWNSWELSRVRKEPIPQLTNRTGVVAVMGTGPGLQSQQPAQHPHPHEGRPGLKLKSEGKHTQHWTPNSFSLTSHLGVALSSPFNIRNILHEKVTMEIRSATRNWWSLWLRMIETKKKKNDRNLACSTEMAVNANG